MIENSQQAKDEIKRNVLKQIQKSYMEKLKTMKTANEICIGCPANQKTTATGGKLVRSFCVKYKWNLDKLIKTAAKVPCTQKMTSEELKQFK